MCLEPCSQIAGAAPDSPLALESREALFVTIVCADGLALCERDDLGYWRIAIVHNNGTTGSDVIEIAGKAVAKFPDFGFFHSLSIIAKLALSG